MEFKKIYTVKDLIPFMKHLIDAVIIAVDTETTGLDPHKDRLRLLQLACDNIPILVIDCFSFLPDGEGLLQEIFSTSAVKIFQNAKFDLQFLMPLNIYPKPLFDTMLAAELLRTSGGPKSYKLDSLTQYFLGEEVSKEQQKSDWSKDLTDEQINYAALDAQVLLRLRKAIIPHLVKNRLVSVADIEFQCVRAIANMEYWGINLDLSQWSLLVEKYRKSKEEILESLGKYTEKPVIQMSFWGEEVVNSFNFDSNKSVLELLKRNGINVKATAKRDLTDYGDNELVAEILLYRKVAKLISTFLVPLPNMMHPITGRLHPHYGQIGAWSGRMSCGSPNIQQIPRDLAFRKCFTAPKGKKLIIADYSQIELRVVAQISQDRRMLFAYRNDEDLHALTASLITGKNIADIKKEERQAAKAVNFGLVFGMGVLGLKEYAGQSYGVNMTLQQAAEFRRRFFKAYAGVEEWHRQLRSNPRSESRTLSGRKFYELGGKEAGADYNTPVQGTAADIAKKALGKLADTFEGTEVHIVGFVHDEILLECPEDIAEETAKKLTDIMEKAADEILPDVPCKAEAKVADSWGEK